MERNKVLSLAGLAAKAGKVASGEFSVERSVKTGKGFLVLAAEDASGNTKKKLRNMCSYYQVPLVFLSDKEELGRAIGKEFRVCISIEDEHLAEAVAKVLGEIETKA